MINQSPKPTKNEWDYVENEKGELQLVRYGTPYRELEQANIAKLKMKVLLRLSEGKNFTQICKARDMPNRITIWRWMEADDTFRKQVELARKVRADVFADKFERVAKEVNHANDRSSRIKADVYKHLMAVSDRDRFGNQTKISGDASAPLAITFNTGIQREAPVDVTPSEEKKLVESD